MNVLQAEADGNEYFPNFIFL